jgi:type I restriction enzyme M protein
MQSDGFSLDDKRTSQADRNDIPEILKRWKALHSKGANYKQELERKRTELSFCVPLSEIQKNEYDLSINRYKEVEYEEVKYDSPKIILKRLAKLEDEILKGQKELEGLLK